MLAFPTLPGSRWVYAVHDSVSGRRDTVTVNSERLVRRADGSSTYLWRYASGSRDDSAFITVRPGSVGIDHSLTSPRHTINFLYPLEIGNRWTSDEMRLSSPEDSIEV